MASRDAQIRAVATQIEGLLSNLRQTVNALTTVLAPPAEPPPSEGKEPVAS